MSGELSEVNKEKLIADFKMVVADTEELQDRLNIAKLKLAEAEEILVDKAKQVGRAADDYVHDNPWSSVGMAAGVGFLIGLLVGRR